MTARHPIILATLLATALSSTAADEIVERIDSARRAYEAGELQQAKQHLQQATNEIDAHLTAQRLTLLPEALPGWRALPAESDAPGIAAILTGTTLSKIYTREADGAQVTLSLTLDSPLAPMLTMAIASPLLLRANPEMSAYSLDGYQGTLEHANGSQNYEATLLVEKRLVVRATGTTIENEAPLRDYLQALDIKQVIASLPK